MLNRRILLVKQLYRLTKYEYWALTRNNIEALEWLQDKQEYLMERIELYNFNNEMTKNEREIILPILKRIKRLKDRLIRLEKDKRDILQSKYFYNRIKYLRSYKYFTN